MSMANETMNLSEKDDTNFFVRVVRYFIPWKGDGAGEVFRKIVFMFSIVLFCVSLNERRSVQKDSVHVLYRAFLCFS